VPERAERVEDAGGPPGRRRGRQEERGDGQGDGHEDRDAEEGAAPQDAAEHPAHERADGDAEAERCLVEDDRLRHGPAGRADDRRESGGDEERVAETPEGAPADDARDGARRPGQGRADDDDAETDEQGRFAPMRLETTPVISIATPMTAM